MVPDKLSARVAALGFLGPLLIQEIQTVFHDLAAEYLLALGRGEDAEQAFKRVFLARESSSSRGMARRTPREDLLPSEVQPPGGNSASRGNPPPGFPDLCPRVSGG